MGKIFLSEREAKIAAAAEAAEQVRLRGEELNRERFSGLLSHQSRERLRKIVRAEHLRHYPAEWLTDYECDKFIDSWGEGYVEAQLRRGEV